METTEKEISAIHGTGAIFMPLDPRNFTFGCEIGDATTPFDWNNGYDVEQELSNVIGESTTLYVNDQNGSSSCGGQASSKHGEVLSAFHNKKYVRKSAKFPYAQVFVGHGGSAAEDLFRIATKQGFCDESLLTSYDMNQPPTEPFMERKQDIVQSMIDASHKDRAMAYAIVNRTIDSVAQAIQNSKGAIIGIYGINNGTWRTEFPLPAANNADVRDLWAHWVYAGKAKMINGKKYIGFLNSWGKSTGANGWQWISEDYFNATYGIWVIWTQFYDGSAFLPGNLFASVLRYGMRANGDVKRLQIMLGIKDDGIFGKGTLSAVKKFQSDHGLIPDGIVGIKTQAELKKLPIT